VSNGGSIGGVGHVGGLNGLTGGLGDLVVDIATGDLGHGVAVLNLNGDNLDLGVVNAMLGGNLTASVLDGGGDGVSNSVSSNWGNSNRGSSERSSNSVGSIRVSKELRISLGISLSITLSNGVVSNSSRDNSGLVTDSVNNLLADLLVFNLFSLDGLGVADVLGGRDAGLCHENLNVSLAVSSRDGSMVRSSSDELGISLSLGLGSCASKGEETRNSKYLHHLEIVRYFPRWLVELK